jgi:hypothetical protein
MTIAHAEGFLKDVARSGTELGSLCDRFEKWKADSDPCGHLTFGRNVSEDNHWDDPNAIFHVHLIPPMTKYPAAAFEAWKSWCRQFNSPGGNERCNRKSDRLLFYVKDGGDYLLMGYGSHALLSASNQRVMKMVRDQWIESRRRLKEELLFEMPKEINATEFNLDDEKVNHRVAVNFKYDGELLEDLGKGLALYQRGSRIALVQESVGAGSLLSIIYYVQWKEIFHKFVGHQAISQVAVWADKNHPSSQGIASRIFWEFLLPIHDVIITDALQTPDGHRFWRNRVGEAFQHHLRVYYLNLMKSTGGVGRELIEIHDAAEFAKLAREKDFWGREDLHQARKIIIADIEL